MQISTSRFYDRAASSLGTLNAKTDTLSTQISTGKKLQAPSDDAVAYQRLAGLTQASADDTAYGTNLTLATSLLQQADTTLASISTQLQQASELAIQANNGTLSTEARKAIGVQLAGIADALVGLGNTKDARGQSLFGGADTGDAVTKNADGSYGFASSTPSAIPIGDNQSVQAGETAARIFTIGSTDMLSMISALATTLQSGDTPDADTVDGLSDANDQLAQIQGSVGARAARVELAQTQMKSAETDRQATRSSLEDTDITTAITDLQKQMTILSATQASFTKLSSLSLFDYLR